MDLSYLRAHPQHLPTFLTHQRIRETPVGGGYVCAASRLTLDDGASIFAKCWPSGEPPAGFFEAEAAGLTWLRDADAAAVPEVIVALPTLIALEWIEPGRWLSGRPGLREDRRTVVQGQPGCRRHAAATHRGLPDPLVREKCREVLRVRAQVRQIHGLILRFGLLGAVIGVKMSA